MSYYITNCAEIFEKELIPYCESLGCKMQCQDRYGQLCGIFSMDYFCFDLSDFLKTRKILNHYSQEEVVDLLLALSNHAIFYQAAFQGDEKNLLKHLYALPELLEEYIVGQTPYKNYIGKFVDLHKMDEAQQQNLIKKIVTHPSFNIIEIKSALKLTIDKVFIHPEQYQHYFDIKLNEDAQAHIQTKHTIHLEFKIDALYLVNLDKEYPKSTLSDIVIKVFKQIEKMQYLLDVSYSIITQSETSIGMVMIGDKLEEKFIQSFVQMHLNKVLQLSEISTKILNQQVKYITPEYLDKLRLETQLENNALKNKIKVKI